MEAVGSTSRIKVDVRVLAATNKDLKAEIRAGRFREDLYFRLNVIPIFVPSLRDRPDDIALLADHFMAEFAREYGRRIKTFEPDAVKVLQRYQWPGNVRELRNVIERAMITSTGTTLRVAAPGASDSTAARSMAMEDVERAHILHILELTQWRVRSKEGAAALLRLNPSTLESRMAKLGISRPGKSPTFRAPHD